MEAERVSNQGSSEENAIRFLRKHGIAVGNDTDGYHMSLSLYCLYLADSMEQAEDIEDGLLFDECEVNILLQNMEEAKAAMDYFRKQLQMDFSSFDAAETVSLKGCRLENGRIIGDIQTAEHIARMWIENYFSGEGNAFMYEVGIYILFLLHLDFDFKKKEE